VQSDIFSFHYQKKSFRIKKSRFKFLIFRNFFAENFYQNFFCEAAGFSTME